MDNFTDVGIKDFNSRIRRALIVEEAIEIIKAQGNILLINQNPFDKKTGESKHINIIKQYADLIEEALEINETPPPTDE